MQKGWGIFSSFKTRTAKNGRGRNDDDQETKTHRQKKTVPRALIRASANHSRENAQQAEAANKVVKLTNIPKAGVWPRLCLCVGGCGCVVRSRKPLARIWQQRDGNVVLATTVAGCVWTSSDRLPAGEGWERDGERQTENKE